MLIDNCLLGNLASRLKLRTQDAMKVIFTGQRNIPQLTFVHVELGLLEHILL